MSRLQAPVRDGICRFRPSTNNRTGEPERRLRRKAERIRVSSSCRPNMGADSARGTPEAPATRSSTRNTLVPPLASRSTCFRISDPLSRRAAAAPTTTSPSSAACSNCPLTASTGPLTTSWRAPAGPATTISPTSMPARMRLRTPLPDDGSASRAYTAVRASSAARTARSASSSCARGKPKNAIKMSPSSRSTRAP